MAQARLSMRRIREVLRLKAESQLTDQQIADSVRCALSTVQEFARRARAAGISWPAGAPRGHGDARRSTQGIARRRAPGRHHAVRRGARVARLVRRDRGDRQRAERLGAARARPGTTLASLRRKFLGDDADSVNASAVSDNSDDGNEDYGALESGQVTIQLEPKSGGVAKVADVVKGKV